MIAGQLALITAALFTGAAVYVSFVEHPARMALDNRAMLTEWKPAYKRGFAMQASLAIVGFLLGAWAFYETQHLLWLAGALTLLAGWPYTLIVLLPINNKLLATPIEAANAETRAQIAKWAALHGVRTALGVGATALFFLATT
jgi:uncharacterized membrane protein